MFQGLRGVQEQSQQKGAGLTVIRDVQGDASGRFKPLVVIDLKAAF